MNMSTSNMYNFSAVYNIPLGFIGCRKHNFAQDTVNRGQTKVPTYLTKTHVFLCLCKIRFANLFLILSNNTI